MERWSAEDDDVRDEAWRVYAPVKCRDEERALIARAQGGDSAAEDRLVRSVSVWVYSVGRKVWTRSRGLSPWDGYAVGLQAAMRCVRRFDLDRRGPDGRPIRLSTVVTRAVHRAVTQECYTNWPGVALSTHTADTEQARDAANSMPLPKGLDVAEMNPNRHPCGVRTPGLDLDDSRYFVAELGKVLAPRQLKAITLRYGLGGRDYPMSNQEAAAATGLTWNVVKQYTYTGLLRLARSAEAKKLDLEWCSVRQAAGGRGK